MTAQEKLNTLKVLLDDGGTLPSDEKLTVYLNLAGQEILNWKYHLIGGVPAEVTDVSSDEVITQIYAVIAGYTHAGAEGQSKHVENGITRDFKHEDMLGYIHENVLCYVRVGAVTRQNAEVTPDAYTSA